METLVRPDLVLFAPISQQLKLSNFHKGLLSRLKLHTVKDLLFYTPNSVQPRRFFNNLFELKEFYSANPENLAVKAGFVAEVVAYELSKSRTAPTRVIIKDETAGLELVFFNLATPYLRSKLPIGRRFAFSGTISTYMGQLHMVQPESIIDPAHKDTLIGNDQVYGLTKGLTQNFFRKIMPTLLSQAPHLPEWDPEMVEENEWPQWRDAIIALHQATSDEELSPQMAARQRLAYDELLAHQLSMLLIKQAYKKAEGIAKTPQSTLVEKALTLFPHQLTQAQQRALQDITSDLSATHQMHRLIQGDVGSGKTIVALLGMLHTVASGYQATLLAPTDILARQHFANIQPLCEELGLEVRLFTGRDRVAERRKNIEDLSLGAVHIAVGTHALIQKSINFKKLGMAVIDEQHKFGVEQRATLSEKGQFIDTLFMSATPIPRTVVLARYGDLDISVIDEKPPGRKEIKTLVMPQSKEKELLASLERSIKAGNQIYWVCPLIEESEALDLTPAEERFEKLQAALPHHRIGLVHGRMKGAEKDAIMNGFAQHSIDILVATTVIEVGVDVPNATVMVIENAERFGLAQLHQLRGRIGRNALESTCILLYEENPSDIAQSRLRVMRDTSDGFKIAEKDLILRGGGEISGTRQSGFADYNFADPLEHQDLMEDAYTRAKQLLEAQSYSLNDPLQLLLKLHNRQDTLRYARSG